MKVHQNNSNIYPEQDTLIHVLKSPLDTISLKQETKTNISNPNTSYSISNRKEKQNLFTDETYSNSQNLINDSINNLPDFFTVKQNSKSLVSNYKETIWFNSQQHKTCYVIKKQRDNIQSSVFLSNKNEIKYLSKKDLNGQVKTQNNHDWIFLPLLLGLFILASILTIYRKYLGQLFERAIYHFVSAKHVKEKNIPFQRLTIILDFLFIISFSMLINQAIIKLGLYSPPERFEYFIFLVSCTFLILLRVVRWLIYRCVALFSNQEMFLKELFSNSTLYTRALSVFLLPMVFLISYTKGFSANFFIYLSIFATVIVFIIRIIRLFRVFVVGGVSIFYFILYLCALEITPLLVIWKEVNSR